MPRSRIYAARFCACRPTSSSTVLAEHQAMIMMMQRKNSEIILIDDEYILAHLPKIPNTAHKNNLGHVLVIGGDAGMSGAAILSALGAARVGAGLVTIATHPAHASFLTLAYPELMCHRVSHSKALLPLLRKASVIVVGPGLGQSLWAKNLLKVVLKTNLPCVIDADALNLLSLTAVPHRNISSQWIFTPHAGEAARLLKIDTTQIQADRYNAAKEIQKKYHGVCVLKGAGTLVQTEEKTYLCDLGNSGMAKAGMGDLLAGMIGGLIAQGASLEQATVMGVYLHAKAGDLAAQSGQRSLITTDLLPALRKILQEYER